MQQNTIRRIQILVALIIVVVVGIIVFSWFTGQSNIEVKLPNGETSSVSIVDSRSGKELYVEQAGGTVKKQVKKGDYSVLVKQSGRSSLDAIKTKSFLRTTAIEPKLVAEKSRLFVGNGPDPCVYYDNNILYSYGCTAGFSDLKIHQPASPTSPTSILSPSDDLPSATNGGMFRVNDKNYVLLSGYFDADDREPKVVIYEIHPDASISNAVELKDLPKSERFSAKPYKNGFVVYDENYENITFYSKVGSEASKISFDTPKGKDLQRSEVLVNGNRIAVVYTEGGSESREDSDNVKNLSAKTVVQIQENGDTKNFSYNGSYSKISLCGTTSLCLINSGNLQIENVSGKRSKNQMVVAGVNSIVPAEYGVHALRDSEVIDIDTKTNHGYISYSSDDYKFCGLNTSGNGYLLCVMNNKNDRSTLFVQDATENTDSLDKKVLALSKEPAIQNVSAYKNILYITPELGEPTYDPKNNIYIYTPQKVQEGRVAIDQLLTKFGVDKTKHIVINTQN